MGASFFALFCLFRFSSLPRLSVCMSVSHLILSQIIPIHFTLMPCSLVLLYFTSPLSVVVKNLSESSQNESERENRKQAGDFK